MSTATSNDVPRRWLTQQQVAEYLGVTDRHVRNLIARGEIRAHRVGSSRTVRIDVAELDKLMLPIPTAGGGEHAS